MLKLLTLVCVLGTSLLTKYGVDALDYMGSVAVWPGPISIAYTLNQTKVTDGRWDPSINYTFPAVTPVPSEFTKSGPHNMFNTTLYSGFCYGGSNYFVYYIEMHGLYQLKTKLEQKKITDLYFGAHISCRPHGLHEWHHHNAAAKIPDTDKWTDDNKMTVLMPILNVPWCKEGEVVDNVIFGVCQDANCNDAWLVGGSNARQKINNTNDCMFVDNFATPMYTLPVDFGKDIGTLTGHGTRRSLSADDSAPRPVEPSDL